MKACLVDIVANIFSVAICIRLQCTFLPLWFGAKPAFPTKNYISQTVVVNRGHIGGRPLHKTGDIIFVCSDF